MHSMLSANLSPLIFPHMSTNLSFLGLIMRTDKAGEMRTLPGSG